MNILPELTHPAWCTASLCAAARGGMHRSSSRILPSEAPGARMVVLLVQAPDGEPKIRLAAGDVQLELSAHAARHLARALRDLAFAGRRAEQ